MYNVLFYDKENATRSILAESILNQRGKDRFKAYSAGSHPIGKVNPLAISALEKAKIPIEGLRSKSIQEFENEDAPQFDFVIVLCEKAAEVCPVWPEHTVTTQWDVYNPNEHEDVNVIHEILLALDSRINLLMQLPVEKLDHLKHKQAVNNQTGS